MQHVHLPNSLVLAYDLADHKPTIIYLPLRHRSRVLGAGLIDVVNLCQSQMFRESGLELCPKILVEPGPGWDFVPVVYQWYLKTSHFWGTVADYITISKWIGSDLGTFYHNDNMTKHFTFTIRWLQLIIMLGHALQLSTKQKFNDLPRVSLLDY